MERLGINSTYLITQVINFTILVIVLTKLVYKPILTVLEKRRKKIEEGLALTEKLTKEKEELEIKKSLVLKDAQKQARAILEKAKEQGKRIEAEIIAEARKKAEEIIERARKDLELKRREMESSLTKEAVNMATILTQKLIGEVMDDKKQETFLKRRLGEFLKKEKKI